MDKFIIRIPNPLKRPVPNPNLTNAIKRKKVKIKDAFVHSNILNIFNVISTSSTEGFQETFEKQSTNGSK